MSIQYLGIDLHISPVKSSLIFKFIIYENEFWKPAKNWESRYLVSTLGRVKRKKRSVTINNNIHVLRERFMSICKSRDGYSIVSFSIGAKTVTRYPHRLAAETFISEVKGMKEINHINGFKPDNRMINLEWSNRHLNISHGYNIGLFPIKLGDNSAFHKLSEKDVREIKILKRDNPSLTLSFFAKKYNVDPSTISLIHRNKNWKHVKID